MAFDWGTNAGLAGGRCRQDGPGRTGHLAGQERYALDLCRQQGGRILDMGAGVGLLGGHGRVPWFWPGLFDVDVGQLISYSNWLLAFVG